jgi:hypothetical protein
VLISGFSQAFEDRIDADGKKNGRIKIDVPAYPARYKPNDRDGHHEDAANYTYFNVYLKFAMANLETYFGYFEASIFGSSFNAFL